MTLHELASRYIQKAERVFDIIKVPEETTSINAENVKEVVDEAKRYLEDAKFYLQRKRLETSLASVAYCEGLLDALRVMGLADFSW
jgi:FAD synthetase